MQGGKTRPAVPYGHEWSAFRARLFSRDGPFFGKPCYHCGHKITPGLGTVQHLISPKVWLAGRYRLDNVVPAHAGGKRRCPEPGCDLDCQAIAASNTCPRDEKNRPLPFPPAYLAEKQRERRENQGRPGPSARNRGEAGKNPAVRPAAAGREWLAGLTFSLFEFFSSVFDLQTPRSLQVEQAAGCRDEAWSHGVMVNLE